MLTFQTLNSSMDSQQSTPKIVMMSYMSFLSGSRRGRKLESLVNLVAANHHYVSSCSLPARRCRSVLTQTLLSVTALALMRFIIPSNGNITIDGRKLSDTNLDALRSRLTLVPQVSKASRRLSRYIIADNHS